MFGERADPQDDLLQRGYVALGRASKAIPEWERAERSNHLPSVRIADRRDADGDVLEQFGL